MNEKTCDWLYLIVLDYTTPRDAIPQTTVTDPHKNLDTLLESFLN